jgi:hypothetical protein
MLLRLGALTHEIGFNFKFTQVGKNPVAMMIGKVMFAA